MAFWKRNRVVPKKIWHVPESEIQRLSQMVFDSEHTLIAGTTGCGKSTQLHGIMRDVLRKYAPSEAKLVLIDPKMVELKRYRDTPHCAKYVDTSAGAVEALREVEDLMYCRYEVMQSEDEDKYTGSRYFVVIDELAPLMRKDNPDRKYIQPLLQNILQLGRAANITVIACTQAPSRQVIPAELVLNFTMRIGMRCLSPIESRQIVGRAGCETLPKYVKALVVCGCDMMIATLQNISKAEVADIISYWKSDRCYSYA